MTKLSDNDLIMLSTFSLNDFLYEDRSLYCTKCGDVEEVDDLVDTLFEGDICISCNNGTYKEIIITPNIISEINKIKLKEGIEKTYLGKK